MDRLAVVIDRLGRLFNAISIVSLVIMMLLATANVFLRSLFNKPIIGTYEMVGLLACVTVLFAMAHTQTQKGHMTVGIFISALPKRAQSLIKLITYALNAGVCFLIIWQGVIYGTECWTAGEVTYTLEIVIFPFIYGLAASFCILCLAFLVDIYKSISRNGRK